MSSQGGQVTGGSVKFMERVKTGDYEHREVSSELNFSVAEGHDYRDLYDKTADDAREQVTRLLGKPKGAPGAKRGTGAAVTKMPEVSAPVSSALVAADPLAGVVAGGTADPLASGTAPSSPSTVENGSSDPLAGSTSLGYGQETDPLAGGDEWTAARQYTDKELMDEITRHNGRLIATKAEGDKNSAPLQVRGVIAKYVAVGKAPREIPMEHRAKFVADLEALK